MAAIAAVVDAVSGIRVATSEPPETMNVDPFAVVFVMRGAAEVAPLGTRKTLTDIAIDVLKVRKDLARDLSTLNPFVDTVTNALLAQVSGDTAGRFSNTISTFGRVEYQLLPAVDYAGVQMIGYRFVMKDVKILINT